MNLTVERVVAEIEDAIMRAVQEFLAWVAMIGEIRRRIDEVSTSLLHINRDFASIMEARRAMFGHNGVN